MSRNFKPLFFVAIAISSSALVQADLGVGSPAPPLKISRWVKGSPITGFDPAKVYVVEFWAPWCKYCCENIPLTTKLAAQYKGKAVFIGMAVRPKSDNYPQQITEFVKQWDKSIGYRVAVDDSLNTTNKLWMKASKQKGIPAAFIVKSGRIAWFGHPVYLEESLTKIVGK